MSMTKDQLLNEAMKLDPVERDELAEEIRQRNAPDLAAEQMNELRRRIDALDRGGVATSSWDEVMRRLRERIGQ